MDIPPNAAISRLCRNWNEERLAQKSRGPLTCTSFDLTGDHSISSHGSFGVCDDDFLIDICDGESYTNTRYSKSTASSSHMITHQHAETGQTTATIISTLSESEWSKESSNEDLSDSDWSLGDSTIDSTDMFFLEEIASIKNNHFHRGQRSVDRWTPVESKVECVNSKPQRYHSPIKYSKALKVEAVSLLNQETNTLLNRLL